MASQAEQAQRNFIERVRRTFLVGDDVPEHLQEGALNLQTQLNNALRLLSEDLYSKKSHFIFELVQNADDNSYAKGVTPELTFDVRPGRLVLSNNEVGFNEENIGAICKVGASSKAKDKQHHIGEKGIGFKSVFSVSDAPEIHSNGYHFRFDRTDPKNLLGYVVPTWCEDAAEVCPNGTTIVLPASPKYRFDASTLADLDARVLLFLNKLRQLTLIQQEGSRSYRRMDHKGVSHLTTATTSPEGAVSEDHLRYVRVTKSFDMTGDFVDEKRPKVETSTVVLAFPVESSGEARLEPSSYVFAYLPVHQMGFKFPFHADFILNSGREAVLNDRRWNERLRDGIADAFVAAVEQFRKSDALGFSYLKYIPAASDVSDDFFGTVRQRIVEGLSTVASLPSASGHWRMPSALRMAAPGFRALFPSALASHLFDFDYIDERVQGGASLLKELGLESAGYGEVLHLFNSKGEWVAAQPKAWRAQLYAFVADNLAEFVRAGLLTVPCLPTASGKYVVPATTHVFFPLGGGKKYGFEHELTILDNDLYAAVLETSPAGPQLFNSLDVRPDDPYDMVVSHILPKHADDSWRQSKFDALVGHLRYVKDNLEEYLDGAEARGEWRSQAMQKLRDGMWVGTKLVSEEGSWTFKRVGNLYLGKEYKPQFCLETLLAGEPGPDAYISPDYLTKRPKDVDAEASSWKEFFQTLGVRVAPPLVQSGLDWQCSKELGLLLEADSSSTRRQTLEWLNQHWQTYAPKLSYLTNSNRTRVDTTFVRQLRSMQVPLKGKRGSSPLSETYYLTQELKDILGDGPAYVDAVLDAAILDACRVTFRLNARALVKRLGQLKQQNAGTQPQVQAIYRALEDLWDSDEHFIQGAFEDDGLVQLKGVHKGWYSPSQVSWRSSGTFIDSLYPPLEGQFKDFQGFFIDKLGVPRELPLSNWAHALTRLDSISDRAVREAEALAIYKRMDRALRPRFGKAVPRPAWVAVLKEQAVFVDHHGELVKASGNLLANDLPEIAKLFLDEEELSFLEVPSVEVPRISELLSASGVQLLSEAVEVEVDGATEGTVELLLTGRIRRLVPFIARVLYTRQPTVFEEALESRRIESLWHVEVAEVPQLTQRVKLGDFHATSHADAAMAAGRILYRSKATTVKDRIAAELSKYLVGTTELADTFVRMLLEENEDDVEEVLRVRGIGELPGDLAAAVMQRELPSEEGSGNPTEGTAQREGSPEEVEPELEDEPDDTPPLDDEDSEVHLLHSPPRAADVTSPPPVEGQPQPPQAAPATPAPKAPPSALTNQEPAQSPQSAYPPSAAPGPGATPAPGVSLARDTPQPPRAPSGTAGYRPAAVPAASWPTPAPAADAPPAPAPGSAPPFGWSPTPRVPAPPSTELAAQPTPSPGGAARRPGSPSAPKASQPPRGRSGRLLSYVDSPLTVDRPPPDSSQEKSAARNAVGKAAVAHALKTLADRWASMTEMPHNNPGYDVLARTAVGDEEFIEVKGQGGAWTQEGIALTPTELLMAQKMGERYWLCVVEFAQDDKRRQLSLVKNPFGLAQQFRFDVGWKAAAEQISGMPLIPDKGLYIDIAEVGHGRIMSVRGKGKFFNIHVILEGGRQVNVTFNPAKMALSEEPLWQE